MWDVLVKPDKLLLPGGDTTGRIVLAPGGSAANVAAWIARSSTPAGFIGKVGTDIFGDLIIEDMRREGVHLYISRSEAHDTGVILVMIDRHGQRSMVTNQGADFHLLPDDVPEDILRHCSHLHITAWSLFTDPPRRAAVHAAQIAKASGATVSFDPASYQMILELGYDAFAKITMDLPIDILFPNRDEGEALTGERSVPLIAHALQRRYPQAIIVLKLDRDGCYVLADNHEQHYQASSATVLDATGAGDAFDATFIAHYLRDQNLAEAARLANAVAGWVVSRYGARPPIDATLMHMLRYEEQ